ncbi:N-acetyltransferase [Bacillus salacetis]|uniref:N-acetyltransferase n=1 Tax=Bacillus salacetis TaxID=2315464 RepID=A0A3A1R3S7_9BACI|nr:GNAT family N-acetyltransferase [Bacillus salacetis]RIW35048.1 N-acetyltransferase [Bacillus salacetis]
MLNRQEIIKAIEDHHWDYEEEWIPSYIETIEEAGLKAVKNPRMHNELSNKVVEFSFKNDAMMEEKWNEAKDFFGDIPFSLWLEKDQSSRLSPFLEKDGYHITDKYDGVAFLLQQYKKVTSSSNENIEYIEVKDDEEIRKLVEVSSLIWGYPVEQQDSIFRQRKSYISSPYSNGGYILGMKAGRPAAYSNYRFSSDGRTMYLNGSGVLPEFRHQGVYSDMVRFRLEHANSKGAELATCQAREGHSSPVLKKLGFQSYSTYDYWVYNR